jgi:hypothetical protein
VWRGIVVTIHVARAAGEPMIERDRIRAVAGRGLEGDRYFEGSGFYSDHPGPIREVPLNHLVGREFRVGGATLRGVELCEPCRHLREVAGKKSVLPTLVHRGGLHAQVISDCANRTGDVIRAT